MPTRFPEWKERGETDEFEGRIALFARKHGLEVKWQNLRFGYRRAVIESKTPEEHSGVWHLAISLKGVRVSIWTAHSGEFEGIVYLMPEKDYFELEEMLQAESRRVEEWWQRYRVADEETRRMMACGKIQ